MGLFSCLTSYRIGWSRYPDVSTKFGRPFRNYHFGCRVSPPGVCLRRILPPVAVRNSKRGRRIWLHDGKYHGMLHATPVSWDYTPGKQCVLRYGLVFQR